MESSETWVIDYFKEQGFDAEKIPEAKGKDEKSPDFIVTTKAGTRLLIELKQKFNSSDFENKKNKILQSGDIFEHLTVLKRTGLFSGVIGSAVKQLEAQKQKYSPDYCLVFLEAKGPESAEKLTKFEVNLYGTKTIMTTGKGSLDNPVECYFYTNSDFYRYRKILDGAFVVGESTLRLCVNPTSPRYDQFIKSDFVTKFKADVVDPLKLHRDKRAFIVDDPIDRNNPSLINAYLAKKYGIEANIIPID